MTPLPIDTLIPDVEASLRRDRALVLVAPPGSGKTTRVPPALVRSGLLAPSHPAVVLLQPRRVAARSVAARIAEENGWTLGEEVGYQVRFERRVGPRTQLRVETEGILNRELVRDPFLDGIGAVILDEFHERNLHSDLALALLRDVREAVREDLFLIVMSATLDVGPVADFFGGCPVLRAEGRTFPVRVEYRPALRPASAETVASAVESVVGSGEADGHVLVFLPGVEEIRRAGAALGSLARAAGLDLLPLHGSLAPEEQDRALRPSERRKVVLATNVAETSLTIDGVRTVIDSGLARVASYDPARGLDRLELARISRASADQRAGRAGRTAPGVCVRLWSEGEQRGRDEFDLPEIIRVDLAGTLLALHAWGASAPSRLAWLTPPPPDRLAAAEGLLVALGALDGRDRALTALGNDLLRVPAHPRIARLLLAAEADGHPHEGAALAALLSEKDLKAPPRLGTGRGGGMAEPARGGSDLFDRLDRLARAETQRFAPGLRDQGIDPLAARQVARTRDDLARLIRRMMGSGETRATATHRGWDEETLLRWVLLAYPDRVVRRRGGEDTGVMVGGRGVRLAPESVVRGEEFFVALDPREDRRAGPLEARVRVASAIRVEWLGEFFPESVRQERRVVYDPERQRAVAVTSVWYRDLLLREDRHGRVAPDEAAAALAAVLALEARAFVRGDDAARTWLDRLEFLQASWPEAAWPELDDAALGALIAQTCAGCQTLEDVRRRPLAPLLKGRLTYDQNRRLDEHAPEFVTVPSGNRLRLTYEPGRPPALAVRLQELFGWAQTPRLAGGRVAVVLQLLGPNYRPVQVTDDLQSFWATTYFQVRKDLRARYPRHSWPDDPLTARPEAKGGKPRS